MLGSSGYHAGQATHFPAVNLAMADVIEAYRDTDLDFVVHQVSAPDDLRARPGYAGMAAVVARRAA